MRIKNILIGIVKAIDKTALVVAFGLVFLCVFYFGFYIHNIDMAYNICGIANDLGLDYRELKDEYKIGRSATYNDFYIRSMITLRYLFSIGIVLAGYVGWRMGYANGFRR